MLPENSLQLMKGFWDRAEVIIVILIIVIADVVWPIIKKRRQKQQMAQQPMEHVPVAEPAPQFEAVTPVTTPVRRPTPAKKPVRQPAKNNLHTLTNELFAPLDAHPQLSRAMRLQELSSRLNQAVRDQRFPLTLADTAISVSTVLCARVPGYRAELLQASGVGAGSVEISSLDDLVNNPDALAIGCIDALIHDALGLTLLGPAYAALRLRSLVEEGKESVMHLNLARGGSIALEPPAVLLKSVYTDTLRSLGYKANLPELKTRTGYVPEPQQFTLLIGGIGRQINLPVPLHPAQVALAGVMSKLVTSRLEVLDNVSFEKAALNAGLQIRYERASRLRRELEKGAVPSRLDVEHLLVLADIAADNGMAAYQEALATMVSRARKARRRTVAPQQGGLLPMTPGAVVEGLILAEVMQRKSGRPV